MTRDEAIETLKENFCAMCAYGSQSMMSCDIRGCDNRDAIKALEQEPCEDAISRQAVTDTICDGISCNECSFNTCEDGQPGCLLKERVEKLPSVAPQPEAGCWIPVSERLPEDRQEVLVTAYWHETYQVMIASYFGDGLWWCVPFNNCGEHMQRLKPKAWMPLPEPYKAKSEEDNAKSEVEICSSNFIQLKQDVLNNKQLWRKLREIEDEDSD